MATPSFERAVDAKIVFRAGAKSKDLPEYSSNSTLKKYSLPAFARQLSDDF
jgi:hypothetical protein